MISIIKHWFHAIKLWIYPDITKTINEEYALLFKEIRSCVTLMDLLVVRQKIEIFKKYIDKSDSGHYGYIHYNKLIVCWNHKYKLYKITTARG